jgi:hypothetical protein
MLSDENPLETQLNVMLQIGYNLHSLGQPLDDSLIAIVMNTRATRGLPWGPLPELRSGIPSTYNIRFVGDFALQSLFTPES